MSRTSRTVAVFAVVLTCYVATALARTPEKGGWRAGVARVDITPRDTLWLAGYAARTHAATGTLTRLWMKALALEDSLGHRAVLVTADLIGFPKAVSDSIRDRCQRRYGLSRAQILLNASHTHTGPILRGRWKVIYALTPRHVHAAERYTDSLVARATKVVAQALERLEPAQVRAGNGVVRFQVNRRNNGKLFPLELQDELAGPHQPDVPVLEVLRPDGRRLAVVFGYACHPTVLNTYEWSGDYPGFAQIELERQLPGTTALFVQGAAGDQNPLPRRSVPLARQYGRELAAAVLRVLEEGTRPLRPVLRTAYREIDLGFSPPPSESELRAFLEKTDANWQRNWAKGMLKRVRAGDLPTSYPYPIEVWRLGDQLLVALGGEPVIDYALEIKRVFGQRTFVLGYSNDVMGYIPSTRVLREGGYEGATSQMAYNLPSTWRADIEWRILGTVLGLVGEVGGEMETSSTLGTGLGN